MQNFKKLPNLELGQHKLVFDSNRADYQVSATWVQSAMGMFYTYKLGDKCDSHILQYHLECIALEQAPTKWICDACEASGPSLFPF